jgi:hypothetical protein
MKNKEKNAFVLAAMTVLNWSERVLAFHHLAPERPAPMDCEPYIQAMILLCREQRLDDDPIKHLRQLKSIIEASFGQVAPDRLRAGQESAAKYGQWLRSAFPEASAQIRKEESEHMRKLGLN